MRRPSGHSSGSVRQEKHAVDLIPESIQLSLQGVGDELFPGRAGES